MATYNWTYQPGKYNPYNFNVASSANDAKPSNACYVALWGNDSTGNGSRMYPYRTVLKGLQIQAGTNNSMLIIGNGVYREALGSISNVQCAVIGDGDVKIDFSYYGGYFVGGNINGGLYNLKIIGNGSSVLSGNAAFTSFNNIQDCDINGVTPCCSGSSQSGGFYNCIIRNINVATSQIQNAYTNCTFYKCTGINISSFADINSCIFSNCNINFQNASSQYPRYCLFYQCNYRFTPVGSGSNTYTSLPNGNALYPSVPTGYSYYSDFTSLSNAYIAAYSSIAVPLPNCGVNDPKFNNAAYGDFSLSFSSYAKNMSYGGGYIGARSIAYGLNPQADPVASDFENDTAVNLNIANNSITLTDTTQIGSIITKPIVNASARELARFAVYGTNADRNGQYVDATADQATVTLNAGNALNAGTPYSVETGAITYNGTVYQPGDNFTSLETNPGTFTTSAGGVVRETTEAAARENVQVRFNDGTNPQITTGTALEALGRYYVVSGSVTYNGTTYNAGQVFKADNTGTNTFTGTGAIQLIFHDNDPWYYFELGTKPQSNNSGNTRTGAISLGNGDPNYDRTAANVFNINQKFMQLKYTIQVNNLAP